MKLIGITGGVGAGKTQVLDYIRAHYLCEIYLADRVAASLMEPGEDCYRELVALLGDRVLGEDGHIHRETMAACIFMDKTLLERVNGIVHPAVRSFLEKKVEEARERGDVELFFIEAALLIEAGYKELTDELWYVYADEETRRRRLEEARGYSGEKTDRIMARQLSDAVFRQKCDFVIDNSGALEETYGQIRRRLQENTWRERK